MRLVVVIDATAPDPEAVQVAIETAAQRARAFGWALEVQRVVVGRRASWLPPGVSISEALRGVGVGPLQLDAAVQHSSDDDVRVLFLGGAVAGLADIDVTVLLHDGEPPSATGSGRLGRVFQWADRDEALLWALAEARETRWSCGCGSVRTLGRGQDCACPLPLRMRVGDRPVVAREGQLLFAHHRGGGLDFTPIAEVVAHADGVRLGLRNLSTGPWTSGTTVVPPGRALTLRDGLQLDIGVRVRVRDGGVVDTARFRPSPVRAPEGCASCGGALGSTILAVPPDPRRFCGTCVAGADHCDFCDLPITDGVPLPDGRLACMACGETAITDLDDLEALASYARTWLADTLAMQMPDVALHFADAATIARMHGRTFVRQRGGNPREAGFFRYDPRTGEGAVFAEHGSPRNFTFGLMVHELTHAWQAEHWTFPQPLILLEGLAMWTETRALLDVGAVVEARRSERIGGVYGVGLSLYRQLEQHVAPESIPRVRPETLLS